MAFENDLKQSGITDSFQKELLEAGKTDGLSNDRRQRIVANLGLAIGAPPVFLPEAGPIEPTPLEPAMAANALHSTGLQALVAKVVGATVLGGLSIWGGYSILQTSAVPQPTAVLPPSALPVEAVAASEKHQEQAELKGSPEQVQPQSDLARLNAAPADEAQSPANDSSEFAAKSRKHAVSDSLTRELALIEAGRAELLRNNPGAALNTLSKYRKEFPKGTLLAEATVLRVEALIARGNHRAAAEVGEAFLRRSPNSPYSRRISSLLGGSHEVGAKAVDTKR